MKLNENAIQQIIAKSVKKCINEGVFDYPDGIDAIILCAENDRECHDIYETIVKMLLKHKKRGEELDVEHLANSSVMKKYQQFCFRKYKGGQDGMERTSPMQFRHYMAERMINNINDGDYDWLGESVDRIISENINKVLNEVSWPGDINPKAMDGFRKDTIMNYMEECKKSIEKYCDEIKRFALAGNSHQVNYLAKQVAICADALNSSKGDLRHLKIDMN